MTVTLISYAEPCNAAFLKKAMVMTSIPKAKVDAISVTSCIRVRSAKGKAQSIFIQDKVAALRLDRLP
jgi:hypothetical protein